MPRKLANGADLVGNKIINVADGSNPADAVNFGQLQAFLNGLAWKQSVRAASTTNVTLTAPGATLDGVTLVTGDRVLLKDQTNAAENGVYVWNGASTALTRASDAATGAQLLSAAVLVREGTTNKDRGYTQTTDGTIIPGTTGLVWAQFGGMTVYTGQNGVTVTGTVITAQVASGGGLIASAAGLGIDPSLVTRKFSTNIGDGTSTTITVTHGLATTDVSYSLRYTSTGEVFDADVVVTSANALTVTTAVALASGAARIVVVG